MPKYPFCSTTPIYTQIRRKLWNETFQELFYVQLIYKQFQRCQNFAEQLKVQCIDQSNCLKAVFCCFQQMCIDKHFALNIEMSFSFINQFGF